MSGPKACASQPTAAQGRHATDSEIATSTGSTKLFSTVDGVSTYKEIDPSKAVVLNLWVEIPLGLNGPFTRVT